MYSVTSRYQYFIPFMTEWLISCRAAQCSKFFKKYREPSTQPWADIRHLFSISQGSERPTHVQVGVKRELDSILWWGSVEALGEHLRLEILLQPLWEEADCQCTFCFSLSFTYLLSLQDLWCSNIIGNFTW